MPKQRWSRWALCAQEKKDATELQQSSKDLKEDIKRAEEREAEATRSRDAALLPLGNLVHDSVPVSNDEVPHLLLQASIIHSKTLI